MWSKRILKDQRWKLKRNLVIKYQNWRIKRLIYKRKRITLEIIRANE